MKSPILRETIEFTVERTGGCLFEALVGAEQGAAADALVNELVEFRPTGKTFAALIDHALRANKPVVAAALFERAKSVVPHAERKVVDEAARALPPGVGNP